MIWKFEVRIRSILTGVISCILIVMLSAWNTKDDLVDRNAILFYASKIPQLYKKKDPNVREFVTHKRTKIFFVHMNAPTKIDFFVSTYNRPGHSLWEQPSDNAVHVDSAVALRYQLIEGISSVKTSDSFCLKVSFMDPVEDNGCIYIGAVVSLIGKYSDMFRGHLLCKYNKEGTLINYHFGGGTP